MLVDELLRPARSYSDQKGPERVDAIRSEKTRDSSASPEVSLLVDGDHAHGRPLAVVGCFCASICVASDASAASLSTPFAHTHASTSASVTDA